MKQEPLVLTYLGELEALLPRRCARPRRRASVAAPASWPPRHVPAALTVHALDPWNAGECEAMDRMFAYRPTRRIFAAASAALLADARAFEANAEGETSAKAMQRRRAFLQLVKQVAETDQLGRMWNARERGSQARLGAALADAGVADDRDRQVLAALLLDPLLLGPPPRADAPRSLLAPLFGGGAAAAERDERAAAAAVARRVAAPLARRGLGRYASTLGARAAELWAAREAGGVAGLEAELAGDPAFGLSDPSERSALARTLLHPTALPFRASLATEVSAAGLGDFRGLVEKHELALCGARDYGGADAVRRAAAGLAERDPLDKEARSSAISELLYLAQIELVFHDILEPLIQSFPSPRRLKAKLSSIVR